MGLIKKVGIIKAVLVAFSLGSINLFSLLFLRCEF